MPSFLVMGSRMPSTMNRQQYMSALTCPILCMSHKPRWPPNVALHQELVRTAGESALCGE